MESTQLLIVGAGPYAPSTAALARERGIETVIVGRPTGFWREHMPAGMFLRSSAEWHLDASGVHSLEAYLPEEDIAADVEVRDSGSGGPLEVKLSDGARLHVDQIVLGTGYRADLPAVPYLAGVLGEIELEEGYPRLGDALDSSRPGLSFTGFAAARD